MFGAADQIGLDAGLRELIANAVGKEAAHHEHHADAHVEDLVHLGLLDAAEPLQPGEDRRHGPAATVDDNLHAGRNHAGQVLVQPAAGDVGDGMHDVLHAIVRQYLPHGPDVDPRGREQGLADRRAKLLDAVRDLVPADLKGDLAGQAVTVGMQAAGGKPQHGVAGRYRACRR